MDLARHHHKALGLFGQHARGLEVTASSPGFAGRRNLAGLGDWFSDGVNALTNSGVQILGAITGSTAQAEAQRNAVAIAQAQAASDMARSQSLSNAIPWVAGAVGLVAVAIVVLKK